ncbi:hypothetical protein ACNF40_03490 [Cuniculiplasma sp. SKW4]|uniref:hypothetical protein n=1 Tax=Cuniculiplasma sp. SKW4 TaxID=3400171 RepID=UPI003FD43E52
MISTGLTELKKTLITQATVLGLNYTYYENIDLEGEENDSRKIIEIMEKCVTQNIDPWKVNVIDFARIVGELVDKNLVSLPEAGYIIYRSWGIVYLQSEELLKAFQKIEESGSDTIVEEFPENPLDYNMMEREEMEKLKISMPIHHHEPRKVMLVELIEVMKQTERIREKIKRNPEVQQIKDVEGILSALNMDEPEKELERVMNNIFSRSSPEFFMESIWGDDRESRMKFFIYCMFIQRNGLIDMKQEVSYDRIWIRKTN